MTPFYGWDSTISSRQSHCELIVCFLPLSPLKFFVLIGLILEGWTAETNLEAPSGFEPEP